VGFTLLHGVVLSKKISGNDCGFLCVLLENNRHKKSQFLGWLLVD